MEFIEDIVIKTFQTLCSLGTEINMEKHSSSRLIFPKKDQSVERVSEQELRQIFIETFNAIKNNQYFYSIETPTELVYSFAYKLKPKWLTKQERKECYKSANIDMTIHSSTGMRVAIIEFKAHNPLFGEYNKDMCKLLNEPTPLKRYFIQLISGGTTIETLYNKYEEAEAFRSDNLCIYVLNIKSKALYKIVNREITKIK